MRHILGITFASGSLLRSYKPTSVLLFVSFRQKNWSRCIGFVRHFTRKVDQRQMESRRKENEFVVALYDL